MADGEEADLNAATPSVAMANRERRPYSFVAALETGRASWTALLDVVRLGPADDATAVTADQLRAVIKRLITAGHWRPGHRDCR